MTKIAVKIQLRKEILDTKGRALLKRLQNDDLLVAECRYGKYIELHLKETDTTKALEQAKQLTKKILHNDLIETFELEVLK